MGIIGTILSAIFQGFLGMFGMSDAQKLGRLQIENRDTKAELEEKTNEAKAFEKPARDIDAINDSFGKL